jgi:uncharacterized protein YbjT (DUF2867 family)
MILVTSAAGTTGQAVVSALVSQGATIRAFTRKNAAVLSASGAHEAVCGDLTNAGDVRAAMRGVKGVYHICPSFSEEVLIGTTMIAAAKEAGVEHFAFHSVFHPFITELPHHMAKLEITASLILSGIPYTILEPAQYMQNLFRDWQVIKRDGIYPLPYSPDVRMRLVDVVDVAEAAARILTTDALRGGIYELCSRSELTRHEMAHVIGQSLGRPIRATLLDRETYAQRMSRLRSPEGLLRQMAMVDFYNRNGFTGGNPSVLEMILGRRSTMYHEFVERFVRDDPG